jgi:methyl-accepting chemotaxis protein
MIALTLTWVGMACWLVCFWWMHRISSRQDILMKELHDMTARIEQLSERGHDMIQEVHPQVSEIKEQMDSVKEAVSQDSSSAKR